MHLQENTLYDICPSPLRQGHMKCYPVPSTLCDIMHLQILKLLRPTFKEEMHLEENTLYDQGHAKCCSEPLHYDFL